MPRNPGGLASIDPLRDRSAPGTARAWPLHARGRAVPLGTLSRTFLGAHPWAPHGGVVFEVDVVTGELFAWALDFELPGPIPLFFERTYNSRESADGPLGPAWHHPLNASVQETERRVMVRLPYTPCFGCPLCHVDSLLVSLTRSL